MTVVALPGAAGASSVSLAPREDVSAAAPVTTCTTSSTQHLDSCALGTLTDTSLTATVTIVYRYPKDTSDVFEAGHWFYLAMNNAAWSCPGASGGGRGQYMWNVAPAGSVTCTITWSWPAGARPLAMGFQAYEYDGFTSSLTEGTHDFVATFPRQPEAYFYADPTPSAPVGTYTFFSRGDAYQGRTITGYTWNFDDGTPVVTKTTPTFDYRYRKSGTFHPTLTVTDSGGLVSAPYSTTKVVSVPQLVVGVSPAAPPGGLGVGDVLDVPVTVTADSAALAAASLTVTVSPPGLLTVGGLTPSATGVTYPDGVVRRFTLRVRGLGVGLATVSVTASGHSVAGDDLVGESHGFVPVASKALLVTTRTSPAKIALPVNAKGVVGTRTVTVSVVLKNTGKVRLAGVQVLRLWPRPQVKTDPLDQIDFARGTFPIRIGTMAAGSTATRKLTLRLTGDGKYKVDSLSQFTKGKTTETVSGTGGLFTATVPALWFTADWKGSSVQGSGKVDFVTGGRPFFLSGQMRNLSSYRNLCLWPLKPTLRGNAGGQGPVDLRTYGTGPGVVAPPVAGPLKPGASVPFAMQVHTRSDGGTRASVGLNPRASGIRAGGACDALAITRTAPLSKADVIITKGSSLLTGGVDVRVPAASSTRSVIANFFGGFAIGSIATVAEMLSGSVIAAREAYSGYTTDPWLLAPSFEAIQGAAGILVNYWETATPEEKAALFGRVRSTLRRASGDAWKAFDAGVNASFEGFMVKVEKAYATGDNRALAYALGYGAGSGLTSIGIDMVTAEIGVGLAKKLPVMQRVFARIGGESVTFAAMKDIPTGKLLNFDEMRRLWGASLEDIAAFKRIAKEEQVLIGIRSRAAVSVENLGKGAVWKHEHLKPKNVSRIDVDWLGFDRADNGLVAMKKYSKADRAAIEARVKKAKLSAGQRAEIEDRMKTRFGEADKYLPTIEGYAKSGKIDVGYNYSENGIDAPTAQKVRNFALTGERRTGGSTYYRPWQQNISQKFPGGKLPTWCKNFGGVKGILCRVTGDMDGVYLTTVGGRPLPVDKLMRVYKKLAVAGWQHPETFTWVEQLTGKFFFDAKVKILKGLTKGGEKMMEFGPDGFVRATWIDLKKSYFGDARVYFVARVGGLTKLAR